MCWSGLLEVAFAPLKIIVNAILLEVWASVCWSRDSCANYMAPDGVPFILRSYFEYYHEVTQVEGRRQRRHPIQSRRSIPVRRYRCVRCRNAPTGYDDPSFGQVNVTREIAKMDPIRSGYNDGFDSDRNHSSGWLVRSAATARNSGIHSLATK